MSRSLDYKTLTAWFRGKTGKREKAEHTYIHTYIQADIASVKRGHSYKEGRGPPEMDQ